MGRASRRKWERRRAAGTTGRIVHEKAERDLKRISPKDVDYSAIERRILAWWLELPPPQGAQMSWYGTRYRK